MSKPKYLLTVPLIVLPLLASISASPISAKSQKSAVVAADPGSAQLKFVARFDGGTGLGGAEISAMDAKSKRLFITNGAKNSIDIVDISNIKKPKLIKSVSLANKGVTGIQSVAAMNGLVVVATSVGEKTAAGRVFMMDVDGKLLASAPKGVEVGALPDSIHFSPNGRYVLTANEGEPKNYCLTGGVLTESSDPLGSVSIIDTKAAKIVAKTLDFSGYKDRLNGIIYAGGRVYGPGASVAQDLEPEYIAISKDSKMAWVTLQENNSIATVDLESGAIIGITGLGFKNYNTEGTGIDPSDRDSERRVRAVPAYGMYQPDAVAVARLGGNDYLFTANEGDAREWPCLMGGTDSTVAEAEDVRYGSNGTNTSLKTNATLGRLAVTPFTPATVLGTNVTTKTTFADAYSFGARSFSVWKAPIFEGVFPAELVYDSGNLIEKKVLEVNPAFFNADWSTSTGVANAADTRSDNKGPEPEGIAYGKAFNKNWLVVGLERDGGIMLFEVSDPAAPVFVQYITTTDWQGSMLSTPKTSGDVSPEGILFIEAKDSPSKKPLVIVSYELSGTVAIFELSSK
ncbi:MAG: alkaline phosphatase [Acidimicrobiia bacterium]|nr:alkaline phosphatase [Acidimicrobiia bacterium]